MDFETLLENKKTNAETLRLQITDRQGAQADEITLEILNSDVDVKIERGRTLEGNFGGFRSGKMHIDKISSTSRKTRIGAISVPVSAKEKRTRHWRKVRLFDIVNDVVTNIGISVFYHGVENHFYENVTQWNETDLSFLNRLCIREGYALKIDNKRAVLYDKSAVESKVAVATIKGTSSVISDSIAFTENPNMVQSVTVKYFADRLISYTATSGNMGARLTVREYVSDAGEAERFAKGYLRYFTENDVTVDALIPINDGIASGNCIKIEGYARYDGKYFITECCHDPKNRQTRILGRRV